MAWRNDSSRVATVSKDGTWSLYKIVDHHLGQEAKLITSGKINALPSSKIALSPDGKVLAISRDKSIFLHRLEPTPKLIKELEHVHTSTITGLLFDAEARWLMSSGDKHIRVFHNVIGFQETLVDLKETLAEAVTEGHKERLVQQIEELKTKLNNIGE